MAQMITRQDQVAKLLLPEGWTWFKDTERTYTPTVRTQQEAYYDANRNIAQRSVKRWQWGIIQVVPTKSTIERAAAYKALVDVILTYYVYLEVSAFDTTGGFRLPKTVKLMPMNDTVFEQLQADYGIDGNGTRDDQYAHFLATRHGEMLTLKPWTMADGHVVETGVILRDGNSLHCSRCKRVYPNLATNPDNAHEHYCSRCVRICPGSGADRCNVPIFSEEFYGCEKHYPRATCSACSRVCEITRSMGEHEGVRYCLRCLETICQRCGKVGGATGDYVVTDGHNEHFNLCKNCYKPVKDWVAQDRNEKVVLEKPCSMLVEGNARRPVRLCSIELEVAAGCGNILADLYSKGLTGSGECQRHWSNLPDFCYVERDGSLPDYPAGGEIIFSKIRLDDATTAQKLQDAVGVIRKHVKNGNAIVDLRTGTHVHVDFHGCGFNHARNIVVLHNFVEDVIYRLGAANYTRHRGTHYAMVLPKTGIDTQEEFNRGFFQRGSFDSMHHSVLNVDGYYKAAANCTCGALASENPERCSCQLGKCTVEFRVFNGTASWKKLHAYVALCQSLVAYARATSDLDVADFPPILYNPVANIVNDTKRGWIERLTWIFKNLWFSDEERESINYCIEHSDLSSLSYAQRKALRDISYVGQPYVSKRGPTKPAPSPYEIGGRPRTRGYGDYPEMATHRAVRTRPGFRPLGADQPTWLSPGR